MKTSEKVAYFKALECENKAIKFIQQNNEGIVLVNSWISQDLFDWEMGEPREWVLIEMCNVCVELRTKENAIKALESGLFYLANKITRFLVENH